MPLLSLYRYKVTKYTNIPDLISNLKSKKKRKKKKKSKKNEKKSKKKKKKSKKRKSKKKERNRKKKRNRKCLFPVSREKNFLRFQFQLDFKDFLQLPTSSFQLSAFSFQLLY